MGERMERGEDWQSPAPDRPPYLEITLAYQHTVEAVLGFAEASHRFQNRAS